MKLIAEYSIIITKTHKKIKDPSLNSPNRSFKYLPLNRENISGVKENLIEFNASSMSMNICLNINLYTGKLTINNIKIIISIVFSLIFFLKLGI